MSKAKHGKITADHLRMIMIGINLALDMAREEPMTQARFVRLVCQFGASRKIQAWEVRQVLAWPLQWVVNATLKDPDPFRLGVRKGAK